MRTTNKGNIPDWVLLDNLRKGANEDRRDEFDFMRGDEEHKYRFGTVDWNVMWV